MTESQEFWPIELNEGDPDFFVCMACLNEVFWNKIPMPACPACHEISTYEGFTLDSIRDWGTDELREKAETASQEKNGLVHSQRDGTRRILDDNRRLCVKPTVSTATSSQPFLLGHEWRETAIRTPVTNPYDGRVIAEVCQAGQAEADEAISLAHTAFHELRRLSSHVKATALRHIADALQTRHEEFAKTISLESGKPIVDARREVGRAIHTFFPSQRGSHAPSW